MNPFAFKHYESVNIVRLSEIYFNYLYFIPPYLGRARCSHFLSACFYAASISERGKRHQGIPCTSTCQPLSPLFTKDVRVSMGFHTPDK